ncbi:GFA family protein [Thalassomonas actiniarum]|uniref:GFA family protein n=1 Tax=Thalassomonas actiniarum TaxID=485447 RepID=A0AAF0C668_9GAMM|nr:GFA family protein [Thalassomonas actiniarum]WDE01680.1 GFA family protein [Thalassomonas actiniarum]
MSSKKTGSCLCGKVNFEIAGEFDNFFLCHCQYCQKDTGSAHAASLFSTSAKLNWLSGQDNIQTFNLPQTRHVKSFCLTCGSAMPNIQMDGQLLVVPAGSLDDEVSIQPNAHIFVSSKADWDDNLENIAKVDKFPS